MTWTLATIRPTRPNVRQPSDLEQLQSLTLQRVWGISELLPRLLRAPFLRLLSIRCKPDFDGIESTYSSLPDHDVLSALLTGAPQLEVRLLMPATLDRWLTVSRSVGEFAKILYEQQWCELQRMSVEMDRVTVVDWEPFTV